MTIRLWGDGLCEFAEIRTYDDGTIWLVPPAPEDWEEQAEPDWMWCSQTASYVHIYGLIYGPEWEERPHINWVRLCVEHCFDERRRFPQPVQQVLEDDEYPKICEHIWETLDESNPPQEIRELAEVQRKQLQEWGNQKRWYYDECPPTPVDNN